MDWPRARAILLAAFMLVNGLLAYALWGPSVAGSATIGRTSPAYVQSVRTRLADLGLELAVAIPTPPAMMPQFLRVEYDSTPDFPEFRVEHSTRRPGSYEIRPRAFELGSARVEPSVERATGIVRYRPAARGAAARDVRLDQRQSVRQAADEYLRAEGQSRSDMRFTRVYPAAEGLGRHG